MSIRYSLESACPLVKGRLLRSMRWTWQCHMPGTRTFTLTDSMVIRSGGTAPRTPTKKILPSRATNPIFERHSTTGNEQSAFVVNVPYNECDFAMFCCGRCSVPGRGFKAGRAEEVSSACYKARRDFWRSHNTRGSPRWNPPPPSARGPVQSPELCC